MSFLAFNHLYPCLCKFLLIDLKTKFCKLLFFVHAIQKISMADKLLNNCPNSRVLPSTLPKNDALQSKHSIVIDRSFGKYQFFLLEKQRNSGYLIFLSFFEFYRNLGGELQTIQLFPTQLLYCRYLYMLYTIFCKVRLSFCIVFIVSSSLLCYFFTTRKTSCLLEY